MPHFLPIIHDTSINRMIRVEKGPDDQKLSLTLQKSRMLQICGVKGEAVVTYRESLTTKEMGCPRLSRPALPKLQRRQEGRKHDKFD
jgi:hypothetical protein